MVLEILSDFFFDYRFQKYKHQTECGLDSDLVLADSDHSVHAGPLKMDMITIPAVVNIELPGQIAGQFVSCLLRIFSRHRVLCTHIDSGHRDSLDALSTQHQPQLFPFFR